MAAPTESPAHYRVAVHRCGGGYLACVQDLPGCVARGDSQVQAVENARAAIRAWVALGRAFARERAIVELDITP